MTRPGRLPPCLVAPESPMAAAQSSFTSFSLSVVPDRDKVVIVAAGDLDLASAGELGRATEELHAAGFTEIVLDLRAVEFIASEGLRVLLALRNAAKRSGHRLSLVPPAPAAQRILRLTGTHG